MNSIRGRFCLFALSLVGVGLAASPSQAAGPVAAQQAVTQVQSSLTGASVGWHRWGWGGGYRRGWGGYGGWGYGGYGYRGYGYRGYGYGYPGYGYAGWGYARPIYYSYPRYAYSRAYYAPTYYSGYSYSSPYATACGCGNSYVSYQPASYNYSGYTNSSSYSYPAQPTVYAPTTYVSPSYPTSTYGTSTYGSGSTIYTPSSSVISTPSAVAPAAAPYPAPPVEYAQPSASRAPVASAPVEYASWGLPTYSSTTAYTPPAPAAMSVPPMPMAYSQIPSSPVYAPATFHYSPVTSIVRMSSASPVW